MTPRELMAAFEVVADAPDGVKRLRELVLSLAVRGKLVGQDSAEGSAATLLGRRRIVPDVVPFEIPESWAWTNIENLGDILGGGTPSKSNPSYWEGTVPWVSPKDMKVPWLSDAQDHISPEALEGSAVKVIPRGSVLMVVRGMILAHSFPVAVTTVDVTVNQDMKALVPFRSDLSPFLLLLLRGSRDRVLAIVERSTHGTCKLVFQTLATLPLPLPPLAEQHRIVARTDELMALLDRLESAHKARDEARRAARDAALAALRDAEDADAVETAWARIAGEMGELFAEPDDITPLRQAILQILVSGGQRLARQRRVVELDDLIDPTRPIAYGVLVPGPDVESGIPLVRIADLHPTSPAERPEKSISPEVAAQYERVRLKGDELLIGVVGSIGKIGVAHPGWAGAAIARAVTRVAIRSGTSRDYVLRVLQGPDAQNYFRDTTRTLAQPTLNVGLIRKLPVPLPPLPEQHRIVARVDALMALCDTLEARLRTARELHAQLAAAAVHHLDV